MTVTSRSSVPRCTGLNSDADSELQMFVFFFFNPSPQRFLMEVSSLVRQQDLIGMGGGKKRLIFLKLGGLLERLSSERI